MAKHRRAPEGSLRARTMIGGALASGALLIAGPAAMAFATPADGSADSSTDTPKTLADFGPIGRILHGSAIGNVIEFGPSSILRGCVGCGGGAAGTPIWNTLFGPDPVKTPFVYLNGHPYGEKQP
jgi:hypothetical protein